MHEAIGHPKRPRRNDPRCELAQGQPVGDRPGAVATLVLGLGAAAWAACATSTPGARPHDMSTSQHEKEAEGHAGAAETHADRFDPDAAELRERCTPRSTRSVADLGGACWTSVVNPTWEHLRAAEEHRRHAADHRAASAALRDAEARACVGIGAGDRDTSPFDHAEDIASVEPLFEGAATIRESPPRAAGAVVTFRAVPGMTAGWLQRVVDCHLARNASLGHVVPEMPDCPLVPRGAEARVTSTGQGFSVTIRSDDAATACEIRARAERLRRAPMSQAAPSTQGSEP